MDHRPRDSAHLFLHRNHTGVAASTDLLWRETVERQLHLAK
jgi:hypothetical protein